MVSLEFENHIDRQYLVKTLQKLLRVDCSVSLGPETLMEPDHPKLVHYVQEVSRYPRASPWHLITQASLDLNPGVPDTLHT